MYYSIEIAEVNLGGMLFYGLLLTGCAWYMLLCSCVLLESWLIINPRVVGINFADGSACWSSTSCWNTWFVRGCYISSSWWTCQCKATSLCQTFCFRFNSQQKETNSRTVKRLWYSATPIFWLEHSQHFCPPCTSLILGRNIIVYLWNGS